VWFGGSHSNALRRAVRMGDGFIGAGSVSTAQFAEQVIMLRGFLEAEGRDPATFPLSKRVYIHVDDDRQRAESQVMDWFGSSYGAGRTPPAIWGPPQECAARLHEVVPGVVESIKIITEKASTRIAKFAFDYAVTHGRKRVTAVHKANIMKLSDGLFLKCHREMSKNYPNILADDRIVDNLCMQLVMNPNQFDILLLENLYGDIVSDLTAGLVGGLGVVGGANIGINGAVFEAVHGSAPDIAGQNKANPLALLQSAVMMLQHIGEMGAAKRIFAAIMKVLDSGPQYRTADIGGTGHSSDFTTAICNALRKSPRSED